MQLGAQMYTVRDFTKNLDDFALTLEKIADIVSKQLGADIDDIDENTNIMDDLGADSLDVVEMLMAVEESFGVAVPDEEIPNLKTVRDIIEYVEANM